MQQSPKVFFRTNHNYGINNKDNKNIVYYGKDKSEKIHYKKCKNKEEYKKELIKYICGEKGFFKYTRNEEKAKISMFDYFTGTNKSEITKETNKMKREKMMMMSNGLFAKDEDIERMQKMWSKYLTESNVHQMVLSFNQNYIDENIEIEKLQKEVTTKIMPLFLKKCGYKDPQKNIDWVVALHSAVERNNYHFHIAFIEKRKCYLDSRNELSYKNRLEFSSDETNFFKRQTALTIEREKLYTPKLIKMNNELDEFRKFFNPHDKNFVLKNYKEVMLEEKILKLGFLLNEVRTTDRNYIKYNSLPRNEQGNEIRNLTKQIKNELLKSSALKESKLKIKKSIEDLNEIFKKIDYENNISNTGFQSALDNELIQSKLEKNDNYVLNAIVNHALYKTKILFNNIESQEISFEDLLNEAALLNYKKSFNKKMSDKAGLKMIKIIVLKNYFNNSFPNRDKLSDAIKRLEYNQEKISEEFKKIFGEENTKAILEK